MKDLATIDAYGDLTEPDTLTSQRLLPGPIERVWRYLTDSDLRARWLAAGAMEMRVGAPLELVWRNDTLTDPPGERPDDFGGEHRMASRITALDPPRGLAFTWGERSEVAFALEPQGEAVLLTVTHRRLPDRATTLLVGPGWHAHLDVLAARLADRQPEPFWDAWRRLRLDYEARIPH
jgi:uncharacterized protein YndB with AHSA1/START domain